MDPTPAEIFSASAVLADLIDARQIPPLPKSMQGKLDPRIPALAIALRKNNAGILLKIEPSLFQLGPKPTPPPPPRPEPLPQPTAAHKIVLRLPTPPRPQSKAKKRPLLERMVEVRRKRIKKPQDRQSDIIKQIKRPKPVKPPKPLPPPQPPLEKKHGNPLGQLVYNEDPLKRPMHVLWDELLMENHKRPPYLKLTDGDLAQIITDIYSSQRVRTLDDVKRARKKFNHDHPDIVSVRYYRTESGIIVLTPRGTHVTVHEFDRAEKRKIRKLI